MATFQALNKAPMVDAVDKVMPILHSPSCMEVNDARRDLFTRKRRYIEAIPSTSNALLLFAV